MKQPLAFGVRIETKHIVIWYNIFMNSLIHADIFFFVTTIAVVVVAAVFTVALVYFIMVLKNIRDVSEVIKDETHLIRDDIHAARENIKQEGFKLKHIISFFSNISNKKQGRKTNTKK